MSASSNIEWCDSTFNYWVGCQKNGPGCDHCYAEAWNARFAGIKIEGVSVAPNYGPGAPRRLTSEKNRNLPHRWNREHEAFFAEHGRRQRVFCSSLSDVFDNAADPTWRADLFAIMEATPHLDWLVLTKRIGNVRKMVPERWLKLGSWPAHVRIGATIVNQKEADRDIPKLLALPCPNFLSMEPLLGPVDLRNVAVPPEHDALRRPWDIQGYKFNALAEHDDDRFHQAPHVIEWVIVGGESGHGARPMPPDAARSLRDQCAEAGVPFLFKQHGEWIGVDDLRRLPGGGMPGFGIYDGCQHDMTTDTVRVGKKAAGRLLDSRTHDGFPS